jgi:hypothetical protein
MMKKTLDAPCEIIWTLTPLVRKTQNTCQTSTRLSDVKDGKRKSVVHMTQSKSP